MHVDPGWVGLSATCSCPRPKPQGSISCSDQLLGGALVSTHIIGANLMTVGMTIRILRLEFPSASQAQLANGLLPTSGKQETPAAVGLPRGHGGTPSHPLIWIGHGSTLFYGARLDNPLRQGDNEA